MEDQNIFSNRKSATGNEHPNMSSSSSSNKFLPIYIIIRVYRYDNKLGRKLWHNKKKHACYKKCSKVACP